MLANAEVAAKLIHPIEQGDAVGTKAQLADKLSQLVDEDYTAGGEALMLANAQLAATKSHPLAKATR